MAGLCMFRLRSGLKMSSESGRGIVSRREFVRGRGVNEQRERTNDQRLPSLYNYMFKNQIHRVLWYMSDIM